MATTSIFGKSAIRRHRISPSTITMPPSTKISKAPTGSTSPSPQAAYNTQMGAVDSCDIRLIGRYACLLHVGAGEEKAKRAGKRKSPSTEVEVGMRPKTRSVVAWGSVKSPGGTAHTYIASSGITPHPMVAATPERLYYVVLRGSMKHIGIPGHSETSPAMVSDSPCSSTISPVKINK